MNREAIRLASLGKSSEEIRDALRPKGPSYDKAASDGLTESIKEVLYRDNEWYRELINNLHLEYDALIASILAAATNTSCSAEEFTVFTRVKAVQASKVKETITKLTE